MLSFQFWTNLEELQLFFAAQWCCVHLFEKFPPVWITYAPPQSEQINVYMLLAKRVSGLSLGFRLWSIELFIL